MQRIIPRVDPYLILLLGLASLTLAPLTAPGYFYEAHDGRHSVFFITMFDEAIRSGALWPQWGMHHNMGYGYPTFLVQAPLAFYIAEIFVLIGAGVTSAAKLTWAVTVLAGAWGMYELVKRWCSVGSNLSFASHDTSPIASTGKGLGKGLLSSSSCGVVAGLLYTYAPYHLLDIYVRAALAETLLMTWFPWVVLAFDRLIAAGMERGWQARLLLAASSYGGALLTHSFALPAFAPLLVGFVLFRLWLGWYATSDDSVTRHRLAVHRLLLSGAAGIAGLLLAAIFLLPLVVEGQVLVREDWIRETYGYARHWVHWGQFLNPFWGYGYSDDPLGANDGMGFQLGIVLLLLACLAAYIFVNEVIVARWAEEGAAGSGVYRQDPHLFLMIFFLIAAVVISFITTPAAATVWRLVPLLEIIQFPWRLLAPVTFSLSVVGGLVVWQLGFATTTAHIRVQSLTGSGHPGWVGDTGLLMLSLLIVFASFDYSRPVDQQPIEAWREDGRAVAEFEAEHPDMYGHTQHVEKPYAPSVMQAQYVRALEEEKIFDSDDLTRLLIVSGKGEVLDTYSSGHAFGGSIDMASAGTVQIQLLAFPGWRVRVDDFVVDFRISSPYGLMEVDVPAGLHTIDVWMGLTRIRIAGIVVSGVTFLLLVALWWSGDLRRRRSGMA